MSNAEHQAKTTSESRVGGFAVLSDLFGLRGIGARFLGGRTASLKLSGLLTLTVVALLVLSAGSASAATAYKQAGEITGPAPSVPFGTLKSESVAVDDHNHHIYVADSSAKACPNEQLRAESNSANLPDCGVYEQATPPVQPTTNAQASFPPAMTAPGTGLLPPHNSTYKPTTALLSLPRTNDHRRSCSVAFASAAVGRQRERSWPPLTARAATTSLAPTSSVSSSANFLRTGAAA